MNRYGSLLGTLALSALLLAALPLHASMRSLLSREAVQAIVIEESARADFPPELALAVAEVESTFATHALSPAGARGVMQLMPRTARDVFGLELWELYDARTNVRAGIAYLDDLIEMYGRLDIALSHYNGGSAVRRSDGTLRVIPATRSYVDRVLARARTWRADPLVTAAYGRPRVRSPAPRAGATATLAPRPGPADGGEASLALLDEARAETVRALRALVDRNTDRVLDSGLMAVREHVLPGAVRHSDARGGSVEATRAARAAPDRMRPGSLDDFGAPDPEAAARRTAAVRRWETFR
jgi:hypothetical protein